LTVLQAKYRFLATLEHGAAAGGGDVGNVCWGEPADMPAVTTEVTLWGETRNWRSGFPIVGSVAVDSQQTTKPPAK